MSKSRKTAVNPRGPWTTSDDTLLTVGSAGEWDAIGFSSGVYFYKIFTDNGFRQTKKLMLIK